MKTINLKKEKKLKVKLTNGKSIRINYPTRLGVTKDVLMIIDDDIDYVEKFRCILFASNTDKDFNQYLLQDLFTIAVGYNKYFDKNYIASDNPIIDFFDTYKMYIDDMFKEFAKTISSININMSDYIKEAVDTLQQSVQSMMQGVIESFQINIEEIMGGLSELEQVASSAKNILLNYDLFICDKSNLDSKDFYYIVELNSIEDELEKKKKFEKIFLEAHSDYIVFEILKELKEDFDLKKRKIIIEEISFGYRSKKYFLTIPVLLAQIEGIVAELLGHKDYMGKTKLKELVENIFKESYSEQVKTIYLTRVMNESFKHGDNIKNPLNRNSIMHGGNFIYGTKITCLKLILILNLVVEASKKYSSIIDTNT